LVAAPAAAFRERMELASMSVVELASVLRVWDESAADTLEGADRAAIEAALYSYLDPDGDGQLAILRWDTLEERGTIGFYIDRRILGGVWERVNNAMLPGLITAPMGGEYQLADPAAQGNTVYEYRLIEQEARGTTREYGPYKVELK